MPRLPLALIALLSLTLLRPSPAGGSSLAAGPPDPWPLPAPNAALPLPRPVETLPPRPASAMTGSEFGATYLNASDEDRYAAAAAQVLSGNVPRFLRHLVPVRLARPEGAGPGPGEATVWVTPDYLAVGDDADFLRVPLDYLTAAELARDLDFGLPTTRIVDAVYAEASERLSPAPLPAGPRMRSMGYWLQHESLVEAASAGQPLGLLTAGHKKDVVLSARLRGASDRVAIYGWHRPDGRPIQPLSTVHGARYADYSHGVRLVSRTVSVDGVDRDLFEVLADPAAAPLLSREGALPDAAALLRPPVTSRK